ncbi:pectin lyase fold/virulence factor [Cladorrhinum sp. PSN332]|nr:pectin lyase fold/virulence factor [Cladorrhinum sp. PSN332]
MYSSLKSRAVNKPSLTAWLVCRPSSLVSGNKFYTHSKPQYENVPLSSFISARDTGAKGNGMADDTTALNKLFASAASQNKVVFIDSGIYKVTGTIKIPAGSRIIGEAAYPVILSSGAYFADAKKPKPVVQVGSSSSRGTIEWSNTIVSTQGAQAGAILIEFNLEAHGSTPSGLWDIHTRIGGFAGSNLQLPECPKTPETVITKANLNKNYIAAFMSIHRADNNQTTIYAGRGLLIESSKGQTWLYGTSVEHHQIYKYQLVDTKAIVIGQIQTETAYYQPNPDSQLPFPPVEKYHDPVFRPGDLYSFFDNYNVTCSQIGEGARYQRRIFSVEKSTVPVYNLNTVGTTKTITLNGMDMADYSGNIDGFIASVALFRNT